MIFTKKNQRENRSKKIAISKARYQEKLAEVDIWKTDEGKIAKLLFETARDQSEISIADLETKFMANHYPTQGILMAPEYSSLRIESPEKILLKQGYLISVDPSQIDQHHGEDDDDDHDGNEKPEDDPDNNSIDLNSSYGKLLHCPKYKRIFRNWSSFRDFAKKKEIAAAMRRSE